MVIIVGLYVVVLGLCFGSFLNVVALRAVEEKELFGGRSCCDSCGHQLAWYDLFPLVSYLCLKGRCRYCRESIGVRHFIVELLDGFFCFLAFWVFGISLDFLCVFLVIQVFVLLSLIDWDVMMIPDVLLLLLCIPVIGLWLLHPELSFLNRCIGMLSISGFMFLLNLLVANSFGGGDIKLMLVCGFLLGWKLTLFSGFIAILVAGGYAMYLLRSKKVNRKDHIAFGPFLCLGVFLALLYGDVVLNWYLQLF